MRALPVSHKRPDDLAAWAAWRAVLGVVVCAATLSLHPASAGPLADAWRDRPRDNPRHEPGGVQRLRDVPYGQAQRQRFDVYLPQPKPSQPMPVILMVHGGGWAVGDKAHGRVVDNKVAHWVPQGVVLVSTNYPMLPETPPLEQARHVARALAEVQRLAPRWGADARRVVLMGHSAGAHLVALLSARPELALAEGAAPWIGTVCLDSAAFDVVRLMEARHLGLFDRAFGTERATWMAASPVHQLTRPIAPILAVCSAQRAQSCAQARLLADRLPAGGPGMHVLPVHLDHGEINETLGQAGGYTDAVDRFLASLPGWKSPLSAD